MAVMGMGNSTDLSTPQCQPLPTNEKRMLIPGDDVLETTRLPRDQLRKIISRILA